MPKPKILDIGFKIKEQKLWDLDIPVEKISISEIGYNLDIPYLEKEGTDDWNLTPQMLIDNTGVEISHTKQMNIVDLSYPIYIYLNMNFNKWIILDGVHRFAKAVLLGNKTIKVRRVSDEIAQTVKQ